MKFGKNLIEINGFNIFIKKYSISGEIYYLVESGFDCDVAGIHREFDCLCDAIDFAKS